MGKDKRNAVILDNGKAAESTMTRFQKKRKLMEKERKKNSNAGEGSKAN
jgi:hypothetical protein